MILIVTVSIVGQFEAFNISTHSQIELDVCASMILQFLKLWNGNCASTSRDK